MGADYYGDKGMSMLIIFAITCFLTGFCVARICTNWRRVEVSQKGRGPNADTFYLQAIMGGTRYLFTEEQVKVARDRAIKLRQEQRI